MGGQASRFDVARDRTFCKKKRSSSDILSRQGKTAYRAPPRLIVCRGSTVQGPAPRARSASYHEASVGVIESRAADPAVGRGLAGRLFQGEVVVLRRCLQNYGAYEPLVQASLVGIREELGVPIAERVEQEGFERIHEFVAPEALPALTKGVYERICVLAPQLLPRLAGGVLGLDRSFYFERRPNVRFHIPFDQAKSHREQFDRFAREFGQGKIAAHGPHRDSWLDCPANAINIWCAIGPVRRGSGLSIYNDLYGRKLRFRPNGEIDLGESVGRPLNFELEPGDAVVFHGDQVHASELNRIDETRYVISFRLTPEKPVFPLGHYHHYIHSGLYQYAPRAVAEIPAKLQWSYVRHRLDYLSKALRKTTGRSGAAKAVDAPRPEADAGTVNVADVAVGQIVPASHNVCVARLGPDQFAAFGRRCPHKGGDLADGFIEGGAIVCPWHNLPFDLESGQSPCRSLAALPQYDYEIRGGRLEVLGRKRERTESAR